MLSSALRAGRRTPARCVRHFSTTRTRLATTDTLQVGAPADHRPSALSDAGSSSATLAIGSEQKSKTNASDFIAPSAEQLSSDHGLYGFFRRKEGADLSGDARFETFHDPTIKFTGRSWLASELRLKSFKDLHTLWYVLLRERNMLATQREEMRRMGLNRERFPPENAVNTAKCRKSMARIKAIMNERRLAYEGAVELAEKDRQETEDAKVLKFRVDQYTTEKHRQHAEELRQKLIVKPVRTRRAGVKVRERRSRVPESTPPQKAEPVMVEKVKKPRWTKAQKIAHAQHKKRQAEGAQKRPSNIRRRLHVV